MDNEPSLWGKPYIRIRPGGKYCDHNPTYPELLERNLTHAKSVKSQMDTLTFDRPILVGWEWLRYKTLRLVRAMETHHYFMNSI